MVVAGLWGSLLLATSRTGLVSLQLGQKQPLRAAPPRPSPASPQTWKVLVWLLVSWASQLPASSPFSQSVQGLLCLIILLGLGASGWGRGQLRKPKRRR